MPTNKKGFRYKALNFEQIYKGVTSVKVQKFKKWVLLSWTVHFKNVCPSRFFFSHFIRLLRNRNMKDRTLVHFDSFKIRTIINFSSAAPKTPSKKKHPNQPNPASNSLKFIVKLEQNDFKWHHFTKPIMFAIKRKIAK